MTESKIGYQMQLALEEGDIEGYDALYDDLCDLLSEGVYE